MPSRKYKKEAINYLSTGNLSIKEDGIYIYHDEEIDEAKAKEPKDQKDPFQKQDKTPIPEKGEKGKDENAKKSKEEKGEERE